MTRRPTNCSTSSSAAGRAASRSRSRSSSPAPARRPTSWPSLIDALPRASAATRADARGARLRPLARRAAAPARPPGAGAEARRPRAGLVERLGLPARRAREGAPLLPGARARAARPGRGRGERVGCAGGLLGRDARALAAGAAAPRRARLRCTAPPTSTTARRARQRAVTAEPRAGRSRTRSTASSA